MISSTNTFNSLKHVLTIRDSPVRQLSDALMEILAHEHTFFPHFMRHVNFLQKFICHHL